MGAFGIGLKNILIATGLAVGASAVMGLFRDDWTDSFLRSAPSIATGLLAVASFMSAREGYAAGQRAAGQPPPTEPVAGIPVSTAGPPRQAEPGAAADGGGM